MRIAAFAHQFLPLTNTELVLLIDNDQPEVLHLEAGFNERVRANEDGASRSLRALGRGFMRASLQLHPHCKRREPVLERLKVLSRQHFGWGHERDVVATLQGHQGAAGGDDRFPGADIALQQPPHRCARTHVVTQFAQDARLRGGEAEPKPLQERLHEMILPSSRQTASTSLQRSPPLLESELQNKKLVHCQALACAFNRREFVGKMNFPERNPPAGEARQIETWPGLLDLTR